MFIYRKAADPNFRKEDLSPEEANIAEIHIAKHRNGPTGVVKLFFDAQNASFRSLTKEGGFANFTPPPGMDTGAKAQAPNDPAMANTNPF